MVPKYVMKHQELWYLVAETVSKSDSFLYNFFHIWTFSTINMHFFYNYTFAYKKKNTDSYLAPFSGSHTWNTKD